MPLHDAEEAYRVALAELRRRPGDWHAQARYVAAVREIAHALE